MLSDDRDDVRSESDSTPGRGYRRVGGFRHLRAALLGTRRCIGISPIQCGDQGTTGGRETAPAPGGNLAPGCRRRFVEQATV